MQTKRQQLLLVAACVVVFAILAIATPLFAGSKVKVLHSFNGTDGATPVASLILDAFGNLYGTTREGGASFGSCYGGYGCGTVFELTPEADGTWTERVLHSFQNNGKDGTNPHSGLVFDAAGNLYGTTLGGGDSGTGCFGTGCGTVFELTPRKGGKWTEKVLHSFHGNDGDFPEASLILDSAGNLYGTTLDGGDFGSYGCGADGVPCGTAFELTADANGTWTEKVLHSFGRNGDGSSLLGSLIFDATGNLYGTTEIGQFNCEEGYGCGTVFELTPGASGKWKEKQLYHFKPNGKDGAYPIAGLIFDVAGNLYGTTTEGGPHNAGTAFEFTPGANGGWTEKVLFSFCAANNCTDGDSPEGGLIFDAAGNLYGTTADGGNPGCGSGSGCGTAFELTPGANGKWKEKVLHRFTGVNDGGFPVSNLIFDKAGHLYGTAGGGGIYGWGMVFEITP